jgi:hypothetical protein
LILSATPAFSQSAVFEKVLDVGIEKPVALEIAVSKGDVFVGYSHDGQVSIELIPKDTTIPKAAVDEFIKNNLRIEQKEYHVTIRAAAAAVPAPAFLYRFGVPFRTELISSVETGNQKVLGIAGPVDFTAGVGDIDANLVRFAAVKARTGRGKISCTRVVQVEAETGSGNINLMEDGATKAVIKKGLGRIEIGGSRGSVEASSDGGEIHIKAVPNNDWRLTTVSGNIRIELPPKAQFEFDASTVGGEVSVEREGMLSPIGDTHHLHDKVGGGGKQIQAHTVNGNITVQ